MNISSLRHYGTCIVSYTRPSYLTLMVASHSGLKRASTVVVGSFLAANIRSFTCCEYKMQMTCFGSS